MKYIAKKIFKIKKYEYYKRNQFLFNNIQNLIQIKKRNRKTIHFSNI